MLKFRKDMHSDDLKTKPFYKNCMLMFMLLLRCLVKVSFHLERVTINRDFHIEQQVFFFVFLHNKLKRMLRKERGKDQLIQNKRRMHLGF